MATKEDKNYVYIILYFSFFILGFIVGLSRSNSEKSQLLFIADNLKVEKDSVGTNLLVLYCKNNKYASYDTDSNIVNFELAAISDISQAKIRNTNDFFSIETYSIISAGLLGAYNLKDLLKIASYSRIKVFAGKTVKVIVAIVTGFGTGYYTGLVVGNKFKKCSNKKLTAYTSQPSFWFDAEELFFALGVTQLERGNNILIKKPTKEFKDEVTRIWNAEKGYIALSSKSFDLLGENILIRNKTLQKRTFFKKPWIKTTLLVFVIGSILIGFLCPFIFKDK